jgi:carbon monoxide dehydrogenase subunit G
VCAAMANGTTDIEIEADPDAVWKIVGDFGGLASWMDGIESCVVEGDDRVLGTMGITGRERLRARDDVKRSITYSVVEIPVPIESHEATITVEPSGSGSKVTWAVEVAPDAMLDIFVPTYQKGLETLKAHAEG